MRVCTALLVLFLSAPPAFADVFTVNAVNFPLGTNLSNMIDGLTLARRTYGSSSSDPVFAVPDYRDPAAASFGGVFYNLQDYVECSERGSSTCSANSVLEIVFDEPTDFVEIHSTASADFPGFIALDRDGNRLRLPDPYTSFSDAYLTSFEPVGNHQYYVATATVAREQADIARVLWAGVLGSGSATEISYRVPEPATWLLVSLGAMGLVRSRRKAW